MSDVFVIDVGHTRLKRGRFTQRDGEWICLDFQAELLHESVTSRSFLPQIPITDQVILCGSMLTEMEKLAERIRQERRCRVDLIAAYRQIPLVLDVDFPERVGPDRLLNGLFASRAKRPESAAIVVASGTALVVDLIAPDGRFLGGTISPGLMMGARALAHFTERLPELTIEELPLQPAFPGRHTHQAIAAGLVHSHRGAVQALVTQCQQALPPETPVDVFLTGGGAPWLQNLGIPTQLCPEMTLRGALLAWETQTAHEKPTG